MAARKRKKATHKRETAKKVCAPRKRKISRRKRSKSFLDSILDF